MEERDYSIATLTEKLLKARHLSPRECEALSYTVWSRMEFPLQDKLDALEVIAENQQHNASSVGCAFSDTSTLRSFLKSYCECIDLTVKEVTDSRHGIDFKWRIEPLGPKRLEESVPFDNDPYGEWDLCVNAAINAASKGGINSFRIILTAEYWLDQTIYLRFVLDDNGAILHVDSSEECITPLAKLCALLKVESEERELFFRDLRECRKKARMEAAGDAEVEGKLYTVYKSKVKRRAINPITDVQNSPRLKEAARQHFAKIKQVLHGFDCFDQGEYEEELKAIEDVLPLSS